MIKVFEMFAGVGGASFSLKKAEIPFECVGYSEIDNTAIKIFELNHGNIKNYGNCTEIKLEELPDFDLLTGGFPCQPFSVNTRETIRGEEHKDFNLFKDIIRVVKHKKPTYILLENVKGIKGKKSTQVYDSLMNDLKNNGYDVVEFVANSKDYGTPQNRERVYFICKYGGWNGELILPDKEELTLTVRDLLEKNAIRREPAIKKYELKKEENKIKFGNITRFEAIMKSRVNKRNSNVLFEILDAPSNVVSRQCDRIYDLTYAPCITATGKDYLFYDGEKVITLTPKEVFRLMGFFNDEIKLEGINDNQKYKLAGNGWDINLVSKIFKGMFPIKTEISEKKEIITFDADDLRMIKDKGLGNKLWDLYKTGQAKDVLTPEEINVKMQYAYYFINNALKYYLDLKEDYYNIIALWIIGTYTHKSFQSFPYLFFNAMKGSGKSRALKIITYASKDGAMLNSLTEAVLFRENGTLCIDEFEGLGRKGMENLKELLNSAYKKGTMVKRMKKVKTAFGEEQVVEQFDVYRPIVMANIYGLVDEALKDRCITLILEKSNNEDITNLIEIFEYDENLNNAKELLNQCSLCSVVASVGIYQRWNAALKSCGKFTAGNNYAPFLTDNYTNTLTTLTTQTTQEKELFDKIKKASLNGREIELCFPLFLIAEKVGVLDETIQTLKDIFSEKRDEERIENLDIGIYEFFSIQPEDNTFISIKELVRKFKESTGRNDEWINERWFGRRLTTLKLYTKKKRLGNGIYVIIDYKKAKEKMLIFQ